MNKSSPIISAGNLNALAEIGETPLAKVDRIDLGDNVMFFRRRLGLIAAIVALALVIGAVISLTATKTYTASSVVSLEQNGDDAGDGVANPAAAPAPSSAFVDTQVEIIASREMAERVAQAVGRLDGVDPETRRDVIDEFQSSVSAERSGESFALMISYEGYTGEQAARYVNEYARQFADWDLRAARERNSDAVQTIETRLAELRSEAQADTAALQRYRIANNLLSTSGTSLTEQEISSYNQEVTSARAQAAEDSARLRTALAQLRSGSSGDDVGEALGSTVIASLRAREAEIGGEVANMASRYGPNHPQLRRARGELSEIRGQIDSEIKRVVSNLRAKESVSSQRLASLTGSLASARSNLSQNNAAMVGLDELERNAEVSQGLYETYLNRYKQLVAGEGTERANARILTLAEVPYLPSSPNIPMNMLFALAIGLGAGLCAAFIAENFFKGVSSPDDVEKAFGPYLGAIPLISSATDAREMSLETIQNEPRSAFAESFRAIRTSIDQQGFGPSQIIAITSALPKEGKSVTALGFAQTLAKLENRTVLIDCDEARRGLSSFLDLQDDQSDLIQVLRGERTLEEALLPVGNGLFILPVRRSKEPVGELLAGQAMGDLLAALREDFDHVVMDLPPVLPVAISRSLAARADATLMVVKWRKTATSAVRSALRQMPPDRINVAGMVLTQIDLKRRALFTHSDPAYYYREYRGYYS